MPSQRAAIPPVSIHHNHYSDSPSIPVEEAGGGGHRLPHRDAPTSPPLCGDRRPTVLPAQLVTPAGVAGMGGLSLAIEPRRGALLRGLVSTAGVGWWWTLCTAPGCPMTLYRACAEVTDVRLGVQSVCVCVCVCVWAFVHAGRWLGSMFMQPVTPPPPRQSAL